MTRKELATEIYKRGIYEFDLSYSVDGENTRIVRLLDTIQVVNEFGDFLQAKGIDTDELTPVCTPDKFPGWNPDTICDAMRDLEMTDLPTFVADLKAKGRWSNHED